MSATPAAGPRGRTRNLKRFLRTGRTPGHRVLVCAGDSITHGLASANYVRRLQQDPNLTGWDVVNAGWSGDLAWNLLDRLDDIIACRPDVVTVLIGTNDAAARISEEWMAGYRKNQRPPQDPTLAWYGEVLTTIVARLQTETAARIALIEIPTLGEDLDSRHNRRVQEYVTVLHDVAGKAGVPVLPLHARMVEALTGSRPTPFDGTRRAMTSAVAQRFLLARSWDRIADRAGLILMTDHVHLSDRGATMVTDLVRDLVVGTVPRAGGATG